jgi:hypothetical protein
VLVASMASVELGVTVALIERIASDVDATSAKARGRYRKRKPPQSSSSTSTV